MEQLVNAHLSQMRQEESQQFLDRHTAILVIKKLATGQNARTVIYPTDGSRNVCLIQNSAVVDSAIRRTC